MPESTAYFRGTEQAKGTARHAGGVCGSADSAHTNTPTKIHLDFGKTFPFHQTLHLQSFVHVDIGVLFRLLLTLQPLFYTDLVLGLGVGNH